MIQFQMLSGKMAGARPVARRFPFHIGRAPGNDLRLDDDGVWDQHLTLEFRRSGGFILTTSPNAVTTVNDEPVQTTPLHNGDIITLGSAKLQFWLAPARQRGLRGREGFVWTLWLAVTVSQFTLIYWLLR
jgi:pSer/pThr/pTyr-binding forkhead associated (FHA) protein